MDIRHLVHPARRYWPYGIVILVAALLRFVNLMNPMDLPGSPSPIGNNGVDEGVHLMSARLVAHGFRMYVDVNAQQAPLFMYIYQLLEGSPLEVRLLSASMGIAGVVGIILISEKVANRTVGILSSLFLALNFDYLKESRHGSMDLYCTVLLIFGLYFLISYFKGLDAAAAPGRRPAWYHGYTMVLSGIFFALAITSKLFAVVPYLAVAVYLIAVCVTLWRRDGHSGRTVLLDGIILAGTTIAVMLMVMSIYGVETTFRGMFLDNLHRPSQPFTERGLILLKFLGTFIVPAALSIPALILGRKDRSVKLMGLWAGSLMLLFLFQTLTWGHYFVLVVPPIAFLGALGAQKLMRLAGTPRRVHHGPGKELNMGRGAEKQGLWATILGVSVLFLLITGSFDAAMVVNATHDVEYSVADDVSTLAGKDEWIICGDPLISVYADRDQPPEATNLAMVRYPPLTSHDLINITCRYDVRVVVFTYDLSGHDIYVNFIRQYFNFYRGYERPDRTSMLEGAIPIGRDTFNMYNASEELDLYAARDEFYGNRA